MQAKFCISLLIVIVTALSVTGCAGTGQPDAGTSTAVANASKNLYAGEFYDGFEHHTSASGLFNNATALWDEGDYTAAASLLKESGEEYALAGNHYHNMMAYAGSEDEQAFAEDMEESVIDMDDAIAMYMLSIDIAAAGNDTAALEYFREGQGLVDQSTWTLKQSLYVMPSYFQ